ncbi:hypothetical protein Cst_c15180 [Thermoclostridium stercorarium subsp. stercorarium DSM 8532]|uniref:Uncharacterized protein n=1 Tax=Thermoclostridium stercorarium (strain ATCC 35414 / DSM 8532 / NCIMB 11754) TaxID=1121335 RepID=L7VPZ4_THES1|nr:hypothetical protein Cst_c15180 [Thermoclostridium stercorarium subsp. stercorarium DSM 8532]
MLYVTRYYQMLARFSSELMNFKGILSTIIYIFCMAVIFH